MLLFHFGLNVAVTSSPNRPVKKQTMTSVTAPSGVQEATSNPSEKETKISEKTDADIEGQQQIPACSRLKLQDGDAQANADGRLSAFKSLGFLDRFLALWIFLAMLIGILLGNFVDDVGPALKRGTFVGVSLPIGTPCAPIPSPPAPY